MLDKTKPLELSNGIAVRFVKDGTSGAIVVTPIDQEVPVKDFTYKPGQNMAFEVRDGVWEHTYRVSGLTLHNRNDSYPVRDKSEDQIFVYAVVLGETPEGYRIGYASDNSGFRAPMAWLTSGSKLWPSPYEVDLIMLDADKHNLLASLFSSRDEDIRPVLDKVFGRDAESVLKWMRSKP